ncbi:transcriptional regulator GcvA [Variovorax sp. KK3]|uniref:transcriptional regulator GcvA n=1 Tax=Variovorax sp. KK3 TaxID=1855728 RepID=UPI0015C3236A|nr:transcriptional regulator GcvA [Variovorax sp. KK3]
MSKAHDCAPLTQWLYGSMARRLPPLNALRAFEAAARLGNFTRAAEELCVTQGAVSRHVATLEGWLRLPLFDRARHGIRLTAAGQSYFDTARAALDQIDYGTRQLQAGPDERRLRIKLPPTFAIRWLVPRLARFHALHPRIDVQITTSHERADFDREDVDVSIHSEATPPAGPGFRRLFGETLVPVCAPGLLARGPALARPGDLAQHVLLCSMNRPKDWPAWLAAAGAPQIDGNGGLKFENAALAYQAAADQLGVTVALDAFVRDDLATGRLVAPFALRVATRGAYYLAWRDQAQQPERVRAFDEWIVDEAQAMEIG